MRERVLVVEDDALMLEVLTEGLRLEGFEITKAGGLSKSFLELQKLVPDVILADYQLGDGTAVDLLAWLKANDIGIPFIVLTASTDIQLAVEMIKNGAEQFISKPVDLGLLTTVLRRTVENFRDRQKALATRLERARYERDPFLGSSRAILELKEAATRVSRADASVLIQGETGSGKGVLARWLHKMSPRSNTAFVDLNCAGLSSELLESELFGYRKGAFTGAVSDKIGFLEVANRGTLFLDEIGDMAPQVQSKILKVVEEKQFYRLGDAHQRKVDVQIIAATHSDLKKAAEEGRFRSDLYFRICILRLHIPPLRERREDIAVITNKLLEQFSWDMKRGPLSISDSARLALQQYSWPGNIRELRNVLERAALLSDGGLINKIGLEFEISDRQNIAAHVPVANLTLKEMEKLYILQTLLSEGGRVTQTAKRLGMPRSSLYAKIHEHGLQIPS
jgi:DNA-binding NtrC family response regulator